MLPAAARYDSGLGEFILMYDDVRAHAIAERNAAGILPEHL